MKTSTSAPALKKRTLALAISSLLCAPIASVHAANPPLEAGPGQHLTASGDFYSLRAFGGGSITTSGPVNIDNTGAVGGTALLVNAGSLIDFQGGSILTTGSGAQVDGAASLILNNTSIMVTSHASFPNYGVLVQGGGQAALTNSDITVAANGGGDVALRVAGGTLTANAVNVLVAGGVGTGLAVSGAGSLLDFESGTVTSTAVGVQASNSASLNIRNTSLTTTGFFGSTGVAASSRAQVSVADSTLHVSNNPGGQTTGVSASGGAQVAVTNSNIAVESSGASNNGRDPFVGVAAFNSGTRVDLTDTSIHVTASLNNAGGFTNAYGLNAGSGSIIAMNGGVLSVDTLSASNTALGIGVLATGNGSLIGLTDVALDSTGDGAQGLVVSQGGGAVVRGGHINSTGAAVTVGNGGGSATLLDTQVNTTGDNAIGLHVLDTTGASAVLAVDGARIGTAGAASAGARAEGTAAELLVSNSAVTTTGDGGIGAQVVGGGLGQFLNTQVITQGANSHGLQVGAAGDAAASTLAFQGGSVQVSGAAAAGALIAAGGDATFIDTSIQATGAGGSALQLQNGALAATARVSNGVLNSTNGAAIEVIADPAIRAPGGPVQVSLLNGTQVSSGTGVLLDAGAGTQSMLNLNGQVHAIGDIVANGNAIVDVSLENRSLWNGATSAVRNLSLDAGSQWQMAGSSTVQNLNHAGLVAFAAPAAGNYHTLTVQGDIAGQNGVVALNTVLNEGGALANQHTDRLLVEGNASGTTLIEVKPTGSGALTDLRQNGQVNADEGISIVQVGGDSHAGAFALKGGYVAAGPWQYTLHAFGPGEADPSQSLLPDGKLSWDYRLGNTFVCEGGCKPVDPEDPDGPGEEPGRITVVPQIPSYLVAPTAMFNYGSRTLDTLHQRLGELRNTAGKSDEQLGGEVFARVLGGQLKYRTDLSFNDYGYDFEQQMSTLQAGGSLVKWNDKDSTLRAGWAVDLGTTRVTPQAADGDSHANYTAYGASGWLTWQQASGMYVDAVLGAQRFSGDVSTTLRGSNVAKIHADMWTASLEVGYPFAVSKGWSVEPQAQVTRQWLNFKDFNDVDGLTTHIAPSAQTTGRVGVRVAKTDEPKFAPYLRADLIRSFGARPQVTVASETWNVSETFSGGRLGASYRIGAGASSQFANNVSLYGEITYQHGTGSAGLRGWAANGGVRWNF